MYHAHITTASGFLYDYLLRQLGGATEHTAGLLGERNPPKNLPESFVAGSCKNVTELVPLNNRLYSIDKSCCLSLQPLMIRYSTAVCYLSRSMLHSVCVSIFCVGKGVRLGHLSSQRSLPVERTPPLCTKATQTNRCCATCSPRWSLVPVLVSL